MAAIDGNRLTEAFASLKGSVKKTVLPFITAGYPDLATTAGLLDDFARRGVRVCELGIPFSDPIADGPVIQASYTEALAAGVTSEKVFEMVKAFRNSDFGFRIASDRGQGANRGNPKSEIRNPKSAGAKAQLAIIAMVSYSIVFKHDPAVYLDETRAAGIDGLIVPDLPLDEAAALEGPAAQRGLCNIMLIAPTTPPARRVEIARRSRGFIYYMSVAGITGERDRLPDATVAAVAELRRHTDTPICVGFGVSNAATVAEVCKVADGAIVGSAIVHRIADAARQGLSRDQIVARVGQFVGELLAPTT
ncbi:MAG: tryptophan synthase subunit alpha [Phycisphaerae bacterium]